MVTKISIYKADCYWTNLIVLTSFASRYARRVDDLENKKINLSKSLNSLEPRFEAHFALFQGTKYVAW